MFFTGIRIFIRIQNCLNLGVTALFAKGIVSLHATLIVNSLPLFSIIFCCQSRVRTASDESLGFAVLINEFKLKEGCNLVPRETKTRHLSSRTAVVLGLRLFDIFLIVIDVASLTIFCNNRFNKRASHSC